MAKNWYYLHAVWNIAVLFHHLYVCAGQMGDITTGMLGIEPPTVQEYFHSANTHNLIKLPADQDGDGEVLDAGGEFQ